MGSKIVERICLVVIFLYKIGVAECQPKLFGGTNVLHPSDFIVNYVVNLDNTPYQLEGHNSRINALNLSGAYPGNDLAGIMIQKALYGNQHAYLLNSESIFFPYDIIETRQKIPLTEIKEKIFGAWGYNNSDVTYGVPSEFKSIEFIEQWTFNPSEFHFEKKVIALNPIRTSFGSNHNIIKRQTFYIFNENAPSNSQIKPQPILKIAYEFFTDKAYCDSLSLSFAQTPQPFREGFQSWNKHSKNALLETLFSAVLSGPKQAFDYYTNQKLAINEIEHKLGITSDTTEVWMDDGSIMTTVIRSDYNLNDFKSIIFLEGWHLSENYTLSKKVIAVSPVLYQTIVREPKDELKKRLTFWVYF